MAAPPPYPSDPAATPEVRRSGRPPGFWLPWWLVQDGNLSWPARLVYARVSFFPRDQEGRVFFRQASVARELGMSERTVREAIRALARRGLLVPQERTGEEVLAHQPIRYVVGEPDGEGRSGPAESAGPGRKDLPLVIEGVYQGEPHQENPPVAPRSAGGGDLAEKAEEVFAAWVASTGKAPGRVRLSADRRRKIAARLREGYLVEDLVAAVRGWKHSPWHRGENPERRVWNDLTLLLRSGEHVERFRDLTLAAAARQAVPRNAAAVEAERQAIEAVRALAERRPAPPPRPAAPARSGPRPLRDLLAAAAPEAP